MLHFREIESWINLNVRKFQSVVYKPTSNPNPRTATPENTKREFRNLAKGGNDRGLRSTRTSLRSTWQWEWPGIERV